MNRAHPRIVLADDDPDVSQLLQMLLEQAGYQVTRCCDADAALATLAEDDPCCLITDLGLPGRNGLSLIRETRKRFPDTRVITLTGSARSTDREQALQAGADHYFSKPVPMPTLLEALSSGRGNGAGKA